MNKHNLNTTVDEIAQMHFGVHYYELTSEEQQWCHEEMVNDPKWLQPEWKKPGYICQVDKWILGIEPWYTCAEPKD